MRELPHEIQDKIWDEVRVKMHKDKYNKVVGDLKRFVEDQRRDKYYISKMCDNNESMFMYLRFTLNTILEDGGGKFTNHKSYALYIWGPYLDKYSLYHEPIRKPTLQLILLKFVWDLNCHLWNIYHKWCGTVFYEYPEVYGYYIDQYN